MDNNLKKDAQTSTTQSVYKDSSGKVFSARDIVDGYKPTKPYKLHSLADRVNSSDFGKKKK